MAIVFQLHRQTHVADLAVEEARPAADTANSAPLTVILRAVLVVEQIAHQTGVLAEPDAALFALGLDALPGVALGADQLRDRLPVEEMCLIFVVTVPAHVELVTARCHKLGPPLVVRTSDPFLVRILLLGRPVVADLAVFSSAVDIWRSARLLLLATLPIFAIFSHTHTQLNTTHFPRALFRPVVNAVPMTYLRNNLSVLRHHCFFFKVDLQTFGSSKN